MILRRAPGGLAAGDAIPFFHDGEYHLFYLSTPPGTEHFPERVRATWEHARSRNLADWENLPAALLPGEGDVPDANGIWTGSVVEHDGTFHIFYTGHRVGAKHTQTICHATSSDLINFTKDADNPISVPDMAVYDPIDWRDPYVFWNEEEGRFWMLIASRLKSGPRWRRGAIALAVSEDLKTWRLEPEPFYAPGTTFCPECPELFPLGDKWYLVYSRFSDNAATLYRIGDTSRGPWRVPDRETLDGRRWYAAKSLPDGEDARIFFGWIHDRAGRTDGGAWLWGGDFTAPREVVADQNGELALRLPEPIAARYDAPVPFTVGGQSPSEDIELDGSEHFDYRFVDTDAEDYLADVTLSPSETASRFGLLFRSSDDLETYAVEFDRVRKSVSLVRWPYALDTFWANMTDRKEKPIEVDGPRLVEHRLKDMTRIRCRLLVSGSTLEVYVNDEVSLSYRVYDRSAHEMGVYVEDGVLRCSAIRLHTLSR